MKDWTPMHRTDLRDCRRMLEVRRAELLSGRHHTDTIAVERVADSIEELSLEMQRNMAVESISRKAALFCQVTEALERIAGGKYGFCLECQKAISPKRLAALPWAPLCIGCQQAAENASRTDGEASIGLQLEQSVSSYEEELGDSSWERGRRLRKPVIPRAPTNGGAAKSEARV